MRKVLQSRWSFVVGVVLAVVMAGGSLAWAASGGVINACVNKATAPCALSPNRYASMANTC